MAKQNQQLLPTNSRNQSHKEEWREMKQDKKLMRNRRKLKRNQWEAA